MVTTANFIESDFKHLSNAVYVQDFPAYAALTSKPNSAFENELLDFLGLYRMHPRFLLLFCLTLINFS